MQERKWDGSDKLTDYEEALRDKLEGYEKTPEQITRAEFETLKASMDDESNQFVAFHKPGSVVEMQDGTQYIVDRNGAWRKLAK